MYSTTQNNPGTFWMMIFTEKYVKYSVQRKLYRKQAILLNITELSTGQQQKCPGVVLGSSSTLKPILLRRKLHLSMLPNLILRDFRFESQKFLFEIVIVPNSDFTLIYSREESVNLIVGDISIASGTTVV